MQGYMENVNKRGGNSKEISKRISEKSKPLYQNEESL